MAIRVSSDKQGLDGDSPEAQREQGEAYAKAHNIIITETIILLESASHETQPMQKVIDVCKDKSKGFQVVAYPKCGKNPFWQRFAWQDGRVLSGVSLQS